MTFTIYPYRRRHWRHFFRKDELWCFDEPELKLKGELLLHGASSLIDMVLMEKGMREDTHFSLTFDSLYINDYDVKLYNPKEDKFSFGTFYDAEFRDGRKAALVVWLCPVLKRYFNRSPELLYARIDQEV